MFIDREACYRALRARDAPVGGCRAGGRREHGTPSTANGRNPISIIVPCHRVIGANGSLTGYGGGLPRKRWLLAHEGVQLELPG